MLTDLAYERTADLRREAAATAVARAARAGGRSRVASRADRVQRQGPGRGSRVLAIVMHRNSCPMGCEA